jgi:hypothetical protein
MDNRLISNDTAYRECAQDKHVNQSVANYVKGAMWLPLHFVDIRIILRWEKIQINSYAAGHFKL